MLSHQTVDLAAIQTGIVVRVGCRVPRSLLHRVRANHHVRRRQSSRMRRNFHAIVARGYSATRELQPRERRESAARCEQREDWCCRYDGNSFFDLIFALVNKRVPGAWQAQRAIRPCLCIWFIARRRVSRRECIRYVGLIGGRNVTCSCWEYCLLSGQFPLLCNNGKFSFSAALCALSSFGLLS